MRVSVTGAAAMVIGWFAVAGAAAAQTTPSTTSSSTATTPTTAAGSSLVSQHDAIPAVLLAFAFGVLTIGVVLIFLYQDRRRSLAAMSKLAEAGITVVPAPEPALVTGEGFVAPPDGIRGPKRITVGSSATYQVQPSPGATYAWTADGPGKVDPPDQATTKLTASDAGTVTLGVTISPKTGAPSKPTPLAIEVVQAAKPAPLTDKVPFLGNGYGTVVVLLAVASVTAALGLTDVLNGQAVAGVLASVVTYSVVRAAGAGSGGSSSSKPGSGTDAQGGA